MTELEALGSGASSPSSDMEDHLRSGGDSRSAHGAYQLPTTRLNCAFISIWAYVPSAAAQ